MKLRSRITFEKSIILISFIYFIVHLVLAVSIGNYFFLAPDEAGYLAVFSSVYEENKLTDNYFGWGNTPKAMLQVIFFPGHFLENVGTNPLLALRINSSVYATVTFYLILLQIKKSPYRRFFTLIAVSAFYLPSTILWTTLGLRESFILFSLTVLIIMFKKFWNNFEFRGLWLFYPILILFASYLLLTAKYYLWIFWFIAICLASIFKLILIQRLKLSGLLIYVCSALLPLVISEFQTTTNVLYKITNTNLNQLSTREDNAFIIKSDSPSPKPSQVTSSTPKPSQVTSSTPKPSQVTSSTPKPSQVTSSTPKPSQVTSSTPKPSQVTSSTPKPSRTESSVDLGTTVREIKKSESKSAIGRLLNSNYIKSKLFMSTSTDEKKFPTAQITEPNSWLPGILAFLFGPIPFLNESLLLNLAGIESFYWLFLVGVILFVSIKKRIIDLLSNVYVTGITFFSLSYIGVSAIVEINTGTAYRHRVVLIPALILLIVGTHDIANKREPARDLTQ